MISKSIVITTVAAIAIVAILGSIYMASGSVHQTIARYTGYSKFCIDGVQYLQFTSGASVQVDRDGKPVQCR